MNDEGSGARRHPSHPTCRSAPGDQGLAEPLIWSSRARTSASGYRRWPPSVRTEVSLPSLAQRVTVLGSTRNIAATSAGVSNLVNSGVCLLLLILLDSSPRSTTDQARSSERS